jgi:hypothetical protein
MYDLDHLYRQSSRFFHGVEQKPLNTDALGAHRDRFRDIRATVKDIRATRLAGRVRGTVPQDLTPAFSHAQQPHVGPTSPMGSTNLPFSAARATVATPKATGAAPQVTFSHPATQQPTVAPTDLPRVPQFSDNAPVTSPVPAAKAGSAYDQHVLGSQAAPAAAVPAVPAVSFSNPEEFNRGVQHVRRPAPGVTFSG